MKIGSDILNGEPRPIMAVQWAGHPWALDIRACATTQGGPLARASMASLVAGHDRSWAQLRELADWAESRQDAGWVRDLDSLQWGLPTEAKAMICAGRNFGRHKEESMGYWSKQGATGIHFEFPSAFIKLAHTLVPHQARVARPADVQAFDYEVEVAAVLGRPCSWVSKDDALRHVFGYTVFNDLSAREWQLKEMKNQMIMMGKNYPGFGPLGPWLVTADEIPDPSVLRVMLRVNGQTLQDESCNDMVFDFSQLISFWSKSGLGPGDMIASGTPEGVALHRKPDPTLYYLKPGDHVEAEVDAIGVLSTHIV
ncbi:MAG: hypothetical protein RIT26_1988 [Pseudomonadota bacterium]